jgi:hypothetical protein
MGPLLPLGTPFFSFPRAGAQQQEARSSASEGAMWGAFWDLDWGHLGWAAQAVWEGLRDNSTEGAAGQNWAEACGHLKGSEQGEGGQRAVGAGLVANSLKCVGERGKEESVSSQRPRHLVEGLSEDRNQITNTQLQPAPARAEEGRLGRNYSRQSL